MKRICELAHKCTSDVCIHKVPHEGFVYRGCEQNCPTGYCSHSRRYASCVEMQCEVSAEETV